jgi:hypothetical protein
MLTESSPEILAFLKHWRPPYGAKATRAVQRRKYIALDRDNGPGSWAGVFLVDRATHRIYTIKGYGVKGWDRGTLEEMTATLAPQGSRFSPDTAAENSAKENG